MRTQSYALLLATLGFHAAAQAHIPPVDHQYRTPFEAPAVVQPTAKYVLTSTYLAAAAGSAPSTRIAAFSGPSPWLSA